MGAGQHNDSSDGGDNCNGGSGSIASRVSLEAPQKYRLVAYTQCKGGTEVEFWVRWSTAGSDVGVDGVNSYIDEVGYLTYNRMVLQCYLFSIVWVASDLDR